MDPHRLRQQCAEASDTDLVRILTLDRDHSVAALIDAAGRELARRGQSVEAILDRVEVRIGAEEQATVPVAQARLLISDQVPLHTVVAVSHALGETLVLQHEGWGWVFHHYDGDTYGLSYIVEDDQRAGEILDRFLRLQEWQALAGDGHHLDDWESVARAEEAEVISAAAQKLTAAGIVHVVRSPPFTPEGDPHVSLLVPAAEQRAAEETLGIRHASVRQLRQRAAVLAAGDDREAELALYEELVQADAGNAAVHYNRGAVLLELDRPEEALAAFLEAAAPTLGQLPDRLEAPRARMGPGGLAGMASVLLRHLGGAPATPGPDYLLDIEMQLQRLRDRLGDRPDLLHGLGALARWRDDAPAAADCYRRILLLDADDEIARFQLRYLEASQD